MDKILKLAVIGLGQRGAGHVHSYLHKQKDIEITYVCDFYADRAEETADFLKKEVGWNTKPTTDYKEVLSSPNVDAVIIASSWETHIRIAIDALRAGKITGMEVGGASSIDECFELVRAQEETGTPFMFLENCCYNKEELLVLKMAREGIFGEIVHCSGAYSHDLRYEVSHGQELRHYRLNNYIARNCENYPTHELGPIAKILDINRGNRMISLVSVASKAAGLEQYIRANKDKVNKNLHSVRFMQGDIVDTIIKCTNGATIRLKLDTTLPGYYDRELTVRGTKGLYEQTTHMVVIDGVDNVNESFDTHVTVKKLFGNASRYEYLLPDCWKNMTDEQRQTGHGGMDGIMLREFINSAKSGAEMALDVYDAASWMAITCLSENSIALNGAPQTIPDFTDGKWINRKRKDVL